MNRDCGIGCLDDNSANACLPCFVGCLSEIEGLSTVEKHEYLFQKLRGATTHVTKGM
jgi:hypothetical protein